MSTVQMSAAIREPRAEEMSLDFNAELQVSFLTVSSEHVWFSLGAADADLSAEAAAMDRLAELATEAAARLREAAAARTGNGEVA
ncbi:hypothetical protein [Microbispora triticiradicis]|uniref:hypothetical protein n=1 Tax=Microbispora triticiradicis TaxID=2200763 RepID=UPI001AD6DAA0|nr:hypothetical protein [Microbispora triticiradicis]MBO4274941.1 hypothetical protein [Microbispora triticiradicis]